MIIEERRTIDFEDVDIDQLTDALKESIDGDYPIILLFDKEGNFTGHPFPTNCDYSVSELRVNGDYRLEDNQSNEYFLDQIKHEIRSY